MTSSFHRGPVTELYLGLAGYFDHALWRDPVRVQRVSELVVDKRWPSAPSYVQASGVHRRADRTSKRIDRTRLVDALGAPELSRVRAFRTERGLRVSSFEVDTGRPGEDSGFDAPFDVLAISRGSDAWLSVAHELVAEIGCVHAILGAWSSNEMCIQDVTLIRTVLDTRSGEYPLGLPEELSRQCGLVSRERGFVGRTFARHPRWGTYLNDAHIAAIGGIDRIRAEVEPAQIARVGELTYIQLTEGVETAVSPESDERRRKLEALMAPIVVRPSA